MTGDRRKKQAWCPGACPEDAVIKLGPAARSARGEAARAPSGVARGIGGLGRPANAPPGRGLAGCGL